MPYMNYSDFYKTNFKQLVLFAKRYVHEDDAQDVVQDIMTMLWEKREDLFFIKDIKSYIFLSVKNRCIDILKHEMYKHEHCRRTLMMLKHSYAIETIQTPSSYVEFKEMEMAIDHAIDTLPDKCREVFVLSRMKGLRYKEIASHLRISPNTVECQMTIALKKLRLQLKAS